MLNYVLLTTNSSYLYLMWNFTHTYNPTVFPSCVSLILLCWAFSKIVYVGFMGLLGAIYRPRSNWERDPPCSICEKASSTHTSFSLQL